MLEFQPPPMLALYVLYGLIVTFILIAAYLLFKLCIWLHHRKYFLFLIGLFLIIPTIVQAQQPKIGGPIGRTLDKVQGIPTAPENEKSVKLTGDPVADLHSAIKRGGADLILHLKQAYALAQSPVDEKGNAVDPTSAPCYRALVPLVDLVVNGPKPATIPDNDPMAFTADEQILSQDKSKLEGVLPKVEKLRILRLALQSQNLNIACGALVQDEVKNAQNLVGKIGSLITGAGLAGIGL